MAKTKAAKPDEAAKTEAPAEPLPECFVVMPISDPEGYEAGHFLRVYEDIFKPACEKAGFKAYRAGDGYETNLIHLDIIRRLYDSPMVLCDLSGKNPNVMFELGFRQAFDKPAVLVQEKGQGRIFDTSGLLAQDYDRSLSYRSVIDARERIAAALKATRDADPKQNVNSLIRLLAIRNVEFKPAGEIEAADIRDVLAMLPQLMGDVAAMREEFRGMRRRQQSSLVEDAQAAILKNHIVNVGLDVGGYEAEFRRIHSVLTEAELLVRDNPTAAMICARSVIDDIPERRGFRTQDGSVYFYQDLRERANALFSRASEAVRDLPHELQLPKRTAGLAP